jgi:hypothetical protein
MKSFFRKSNNDVRKAFSKGAQRNTLRKLNHAYQDSIPAVKIAGEVAGNLAPVAAVVPGYGPAIAVGLKGAQAGSKLYAMGEKKHHSIQAPKPQEKKQDVFY